MWRILVLSVALSAVAVLAKSPLHSQVPLPLSAARPLPTNIPALRIVGGNEATPGQFPHQVGIWITRKKAQYFCGGSILNANTVITAAHCAVAGDSFEIVFGAHEIRKDTTVTRKTHKKLVHENYQDDGNISNDIALLYFDSPILFTDTIQPIRLPRKNQGSFWNSEVTASGWGLLHTNDETVASVLHFVKSRVVTNFYCKLRYFFNYVRDTNICISGWWAKGTCEGDSGGPLVVYEKDGKPTLVGLTSFGISFGCSVSWPSVFTRVGSYVDWIEAGIKQLSGGHPAGSGRAAQKEACAPWFPVVAMRVSVAVLLASWLSFSRSQETDWSSVRLMTGEPQLLRQHVMDMEMEGVDYPDTPFLSRVGETRSGGDAAGGRIVGGQEAEPHQFPWQVGMLIQDKDGEMFFCGGSLLTPSWVLTAAHCAEPGYIFEVILGAHRIREHEPSQQRFKVKKDDSTVWVHPEWDSNETVNDIALIKLPGAATLNDYVQLTRIQSKERAGASLWNKNATMSGWGKPSDSAQSISPVLRFVVTRIVSNYYCNFRYLFFLIKDTNICTSGFPGKSTCNGDSGGPLTVPDDDGKETQVGITSFGIGLGCEKTWPPAFTRVSSYLDWIAKVTGGGFHDTAELGPLSSSNSTRW
ncbi:Chymotrypsin BI [Frankliniella fusca]|uniref:Chymotrypsin BI n=1 Tax=Frankliniella fusca TaxID=407009 RepID=A0AAE1HF44_9NEOP|nr:Chymotrypsin BI [Frankliniella fusca]